MSRVSWMSRSKSAVKGDDFEPVEVSPEAVQTVLLAIRPCDAASLELLDMLQSSTVDTYFIQTPAPAPEPLRLF